MKIERIARASFFLLCSVYIVGNVCLAMEDITPEEWALIAESEAKDKNLREQEEFELQQAMNKSLQKEPSEKEQNFRLERISDDQMAAGVNEALRYYDRDLDFKRLHSEGHLVKHAFLEKIFFSSIFNYYTYQLLGFDMKYNYSDGLQQIKEKLSLGKSDFYDLRKFREFAVSMGLQWCKIPSSEVLKIEHPQVYKCIQDTIFRHIEPTSRVIDAFKRNRLLQDLGLAYMRQKIVVEKFGEKAYSGDEKTIPLLLKHDRIVSDLQTMIYHFMRQAYQAYKRMIKEQGSNEHMLETYVPDFVEKPHYKAIIEKLVELGNPMPI